MTFGEGMNFHSLLFEVLDLCSFREPRIPEARFPRIISVGNRVNRGNPPLSQHRPKLHEGARIGNHALIWRLAKKRGQVTWSRFYRNHRRTATLPSLRVRLSIARALEEPRLFSPSLVSRVQDEALLRLDTLARMRASLFSSFQFFEACILWSCRSSLPTRCLRRC